MKLSRAIPRHIADKLMSKSRLVHVGGNMLANHARPMMIRILVMVMACSFQNINVLPCFSFHTSFKS
jgi:hypothetical protein